MFIVRILALTAVLLQVLLSLHPTRAEAAKVDVNIVAHEDDDLLFMQLDILDAYKEGYGQVTVYITSGNYQFVDDTVEMRQREMGILVRRGCPAPAGPRVAP